MNKYNSKNRKGDLIKMKMIWKIIIIVIIVGMILSTVGFVTGASRVLYFNRTGISVSGGEISQITEMNLEQFRSVSVDIGFSDVEFVKSDKFGIDLYGMDMEWLWSLEDGKLNITHNRSNQLHVVNLNFVTTGRNYVKIFLPADTELENVTIKTSSGDIKIGSFSADKVDVKSSFGDAVLSNITSNNLQAELNSGDFTGTNINTGQFTFISRFGYGQFHSVTANSFKAESSSGDMRITGCAFGEINATNRFGDIIASGFASSKTNIIASSGDVKITGDLSGETIVRTEFGDTKLTLSREKNDYSYEISVRFGDITYDGVRMRDQTSINSGTVMENHLKLSASSGDIVVSFG